MLGLSRTNCEFCRYKSQYSISDCKLLLHENTLSFFVFELTRVQDAFLVALRAIVDWTTQCRIRALGPPCDPEIPPGTASPPPPITLVYRVTPSRQHLLLQDW